MKSNVVKLRPEIELDDELEFDINQTDFDDGDGGGSNEIVIRVIHEYPESEESEPKEGVGIAPFIYGALIGWWLG